MRTTKQGYEKIVESAGIRKSNCNVDVYFKQDRKLYSPNEPHV